MSTDVNPEMSPETSTGLATAETSEKSLVIFDNVSKFYGEVLGVNRVNLRIPSGITGLVGPNGSGKTTLMNLVTGLLKPTEGEIRVLDLPANHPEALFTEIGYCTQYDAFPGRMTGYQFVYSYLRVHGYDHAGADELTWQALERVNLADAAKRRIGGYSKGMRQRVRIAQATSHNPRVLVLDEPLNGLDPMARAETISSFQALAESGCHVIISSHILHEVDMISDQVVLLSGGYVVAEGDIHGVRTEVKNQPIQVLVQCDEPHDLAAKLFANGVAEEALLVEDRGGLLARTRDASSFYLLLNEAVVEDGLRIDAVSIADDNVRAVYQYLIGSERESR